MARAATEPSLTDHVGIAAPERSDCRRFDARHAPLLLVAVAIAFNLWTLRAERSDVWYPNDAAIHASMTRWAETRISDGHLPFDGWYPYLSLGSSRFHRYQSLPHIAVGALSVVTGPSTFRWSLFLLLSLWPIAVYAGARLFDLDGWQAAAAALVSPLLVSAPGLGYEWGSYVWRGSGAWAQLWGMWALPLAWGLSWRAVAKGRSIALAALMVGVTVCLHLLTGYLALLSLGVWALVAPRELWVRLGRAALVAAGALAAAAWMLVPLVTDASWTIQDEFSRGTFFYDSFGARRVLGWLTTGRLFDEGRLPVMSALVLIGFVLCLRDMRRREPSRALLAVGGLSLLLFFGRPTLGPVLDLLPGGGDLFLRRFVSGVHLVGIYLAGIGGAWLAAKLLGLARTRLKTIATVPAAAALTGIGVLLLAPAWTERAAFAAQGADWISEQRVAQEVDGAEFASLVAVAHRAAPGRIFAGLRGSGSPYRIFAVPGYAALLNLDADAVGFTRPTWSLVSGVENRFDGSNPAHPALFGVRWVILPVGAQPPPGAEREAMAGRHVLWSTGEVGYVTAVDTVAPIAVDRTNLGRQMGSFLDSGLLARGLHPTLAFGGRAAAPPTLGRNVVPSLPPGEVETSFAGPAEGVFGAEVELRRPAVVLLKASYDPRWTAIVDGVDATPQIVAPGFVGIRVSAGQHRILFAYEPYPWYGVLFPLGALAVAALAVARRPSKDAAS